jgi:uncharacterized membrane protein YeaQ/YmgE (transglycosylase-associated protein family)
MSAAAGGVAGLVVGAVAGYFASKTYFKKADVGVTAAAGAAGALIGAAIFAPPIVESPKTT